MASHPLFDKILIANRGEIACRIIATCRRLGIATVAVYSDADRGALHVRQADEAVHIGGSLARDSYLRIEAIIDAARMTGAQAIHPGYGFLSENAAFADACALDNIMFIGPPSSAIRAMGDKSTAKALMQRAGVPLTPGYHGDRQDVAFLRSQADAIGYPVLIKASAGGGGKGMRKVERTEEFETALAGCQREAQSAFGNPHVLVEKYIERPRHIEIQVFGDAHGNVVHLFERDCSVQRRHQKVLEEAPAPGMSEEMRAAMGAAAIDAARAVSYVGAGTVEFIVDPAGHFYFMEMNTRLQVEHAVTELITGSDLVEWQLRVAAGQALPKQQGALRIRGHALEARLYAEDAERGFLPSTGTLRHLRLPENDSHVRVDAGVRQGDVITPFYDPMLAKLIVWDVDRDSALRRMREALSCCEAIGVTTNATFLRRLVGTCAFTAADLDTALIEREHAALFDERHIAEDALWGIAALAFVLRENSPTVDPADPWSPWSDRRGWRLGVHATRTLELEHAGQRRSVLLSAKAGQWRASMGGRIFDIGLRIDSHTLHADIDGLRRHERATFDGGALHIFSEQGDCAFILHDPISEADNASSNSGDLSAPMPGRIVALPVTPGSKVGRGQPLVVLEAMKMEHTLAAPADGVLRTYHVHEGQLVSEGITLVEFEPSAA